MLSKQREDRAGNWLKVCRTNATILERPDGPDCAAPGVLNLRDWPLFLFFSSVTKIGELFLYVFRYCAQQNCEPRPLRNCLTAKAQATARTREWSMFPGQQFDDAVDRVMDDAAEDVTQIGFRVEAVQFRRLDQGAPSGGKIATAMRRTSLTKV